MKSIRGWPGTWMVSSRKMLVCLERKDQAHPIRPSPKTSQAKFLGCSYMHRCPDLRKCENKQCLEFWAVASSIRNKARVRKRGWWRPGRLKPKTKGLGTVSPIDAGRYRPLSPFPGTQRQRNRRERFSRASHPSGWAASPARRASWAHCSEQVIRVRPTHQRRTQGKHRAGRPFAAETSWSWIHTHGRVLDGQGFSVGAPLPQVCGC